MRGPYSKDDGWATAFGRGLRAARTERALTLAEVASRVGLSIGHLSDVERGNRLPLKDEAIIKIGFPDEVVDGLKQARALDLGFFTIPVDTDKPLAYSVAGELSKRWSSLTDAQLEQILEVVR